MLRFICERIYYEGPNQPICKSHITVDFDVPELEQKLKSGGFGINHGEFTNLIGVEIIEERPQDTKEERATTNNSDSMPF